MPSVVGQFCQMESVLRLTSFQFCALYIGLNPFFSIDDKDTMTMKTRKSKLMDMLAMFNKKCKEKEG